MPLREAMVKVELEPKYLNVKLSSNKAQSIRGVMHLHSFDYSASNHPLIVSVGILKT